MRFATHDLLVGIAAMALGVIGVYCGPFKFSLVGSILLGSVIYFGVSPMLYQKLRLKPLTFPLCPRCRDKNRLYYAVKSDSDWPKQEVLCAACSARLKLWYEREVSHPEDSPELYQFELVWPHSWGRWQQIKTKESGQKKGDATH